MNAFAMEMDVPVVGSTEILVGRLKGVVQQLRSDRTGSVRNTLVRAVARTNSSRSNDRMNSTTKGSTRPEPVIQRIVLGQIFPVAPRYWSERTYRCLRSENPVCHRMLCSLCTDQNWGRNYRFVHRYQRSTQNTHKALSQPGLFSRDQRE